MRRYAFEALCTTEDPDAVVHVEMDIWKCIVSRTLGDLNLVYGGEVDCVRGKWYKRCFANVSAVSAPLNTLQANTQETRAIF